MNQNPAPTSTPQVFVAMRAAGEAEFKEASAEQEANAELRVGSPDEEDATAARAPPPPEIEDDSSADDDGIRRRAAPHEDREEYADAIVYGTAGPGGRARRTTARCRLATPPGVVFQLRARRDGAAFSRGWIPTTTARRAGGTRARKRRRRSSGSSSTGGGGDSEHRQRMTIDE